MTPDLASQYSHGLYVGMEFHVKLRKLMKAARFSQEMIARELDVHQTQISKWVRGLSVPDSRMGFRLAGLLGTSLDYLMDDEQDESPRAITPEERVIVESYRLLRISAAEAIDRMKTVPGEGFKGIPAVARDVQAPRRLKNDR